MSRCLGSSHLRLVIQMESDAGGLMAELNTLKQQMESSLSQAEREKLEALSRAEREKAEVLARAEKEKMDAIMRAESSHEMEFEKLKGLLSASQREGFMLKQESGIMKSWKRL